MVFTIVAAFSGSKPRLVRARVSIAQLWVPFLFDSGTIKMGVKLGLSYTLIPIELSSNFFEAYGLLCHSNSKSAEEEERIKSKWISFKKLNRFIKLIYQFDFSKFIINFNIRIKLIFSFKIQ